MKSFIKLNFVLILFFTASNVMSQHKINMDISVNNNDKTILISQKITFFNQSTDTISSIVLNDWNNAFSSKSTMLGKRFSDEFIRSFQLSSIEERGNTNIIDLKDENNANISYKRLIQNVDLIEVSLKNKILPNQKFSFTVKYKVKIPSDKFTNFGYNENGEINLKDWFLSISRYENHSFAKYSNVNIDDIANAVTDYNIKINVPKDLELTTDLDISENDSNTVTLTGKSRNSFILFFETKNSFTIYKNDNITVATNLKENKIDEIKKAIIINKIITFGKENLGKYPFEKIIISQNDYDRNPFYGLNQLPRFLNPFQNDFIYELKFLKTYLNIFLKTSLHLDPRKDNYIYDGIQVFLMMKYIDENYPNSKMMGSIARFKLLKSFYLVNLDFNEQYNYFYMLMARANLDQSIGDSKESLIRFNEKIAGKYRAGLSFKYLDSYLNNNIVQKSFVAFCKINNAKQTTNRDFEAILKNKSPKKIDWFFETIVNSRKIIDYKIKTAIKSENKVSVIIKNKSDAVVPISIYGLNRKEVVFKYWLENIKTDSLFSFDNKNVDKLVLNYYNEVPEYNLRNNFKKIKGFFPNNRPIKFAFMKDLEDPKYNQILYVPAFNYNFYDGITAGIRLHNSTMLDRPFNFDIEPLYGTKSKSLTGSISFSLNKMIRNSRLYNIQYSINASTAHYAPDASYTKFNPVISLNFREKDFRSNHRQSLIFREITVNRQQSNYVITENSENYSVFNTRFVSVKNELTKNFYYSTDLQVANKFGKVAANIGFRKMFDDNRQINLRLYSGMFLYKNTDSNFFNFALDRPTDYLFDFDYLGRSESTGIFSQQLIIAEGGFKTKLADLYANQWITSLNGGVSIWNWVEVYSDAAVYKNTYTNPKFVYDTGIRLNFVPDYFELYFPVYSSNGWDISKNYNEKIRFSFTISTNTLVSLFTRKWF